MEINLKFMMFRLMEKAFASQNIESSHFLLVSPLQTLLQVLIINPRFN